MSLKVKRACVLGAGVMGAQIATHLAACGIRTYLLDLESSELPQDPKRAAMVKNNPRSQRALLALEDLKKLKPSPIASLKHLDGIICGNFADDMSVIADCDWVIEAVIERLDIKKSIHAKIQQYVRPGVPVSTNTSGIPLKKICEDLPESYQSQFLGSHFFNPPRYMNLLEMIPHENTDPKLFNDICTFANEIVGKGIVRACDTINFIGNRIGVLGIMSAFKNQGDLNIETIDALTGPLIGRPKSATFRTVDVVGLDTFAHVAKNVYDLVKDDPMHAHFAMPEWVTKLAEGGFIGQKSKLGGFYKKDKTGILAYRPATAEHAEQVVADIPWLKEAKKHKDLAARLGFIFDLAPKDPYANFLWQLHSDVFSYSASLLEEIAAGSPCAVDDALRWGFNWELGPFELWQKMGVNKITQMLKESGRPLPSWLNEKTMFYNEVSEFIQPKQKAQALKKPEYPLPATPGTQRVIGNESASLVDIGDGIACLSFHSKMNTLNAQIFEVFQQSIAAVSTNFDGLIIANDADNFSAGADLSLIGAAIEAKDWQKIDDIIRNFQGCVQMLKYAPFPSVAAIQGLVLGGGCEVALHAGQIIAANQSFVGLVEVGVGLIPAGGGTKELALRAYESVPEGEDATAFLKRAFLLIGMAQVSTSGFEAIENGLLPNSSQVSISKEHLTRRAKALCQAQLAVGYKPPVPRTRIKVLGDPGIQTFRMMLYNMVEGLQISAYDAEIATKVATVLCGGEIDRGSVVSEQYLLELERRCFVELCQQEKTKDRITHMLKTGKPLRN
jgi:3-hydroxyacyl-CoA dehydrogenase